MCIYFLENHEPICIILLLIFPFSMHKRVVSDSVKPFFSFNKQRLQYYNISIDTLFTYIYIFTLLMAKACTGSDPVKSMFF